MVRAATEADLYIAEVKTLVNAGVLGKENFPSTGYWSWPILQPELLTERVKQQSIIPPGMDEIRWYW